MRFRYRLGDERREGKVLSVRSLGPGGWVELELADGIRVQTIERDLDRLYPEWRAYLQEEPMGWKPVRQSGDLIKWDEARTVEGFYQGSEERSTEYGENTIHFIETTDGRIAFFGTTLLNDGLKNIKTGELVRVTYTGKQTKTPKGRMKEFVIEVHEPDPEPTAAATA